MIGYQVIGHYKSLRPEHISSTTISDGAIFATHEEAEEYARPRMHPGYTVKRCQTTHYHNPATGALYTEPADESAA